MSHYKSIINVQFVELHLYFIFKGVPTSKRRPYSPGGRSSVFHLKNVLIINNTRYRLCHDVVN